MTTPEITLIAALDHRRTIGVDGHMPWHLPADLAWFKSQTMGKTLLMGRRTWDSIGMALPGRTTIVISRQPELELPGATVAHSVEEALQGTRETPELMVCGGAMIYAACLPIATRLLLTVVHTELDGDTFFPPFSMNDWEIDSQVFRAADDKNAFDLSFSSLRRAPASDTPPAPGHQLETEGLPLSLRKPAGNR